MTEAAIHGSLFAVDFLKETIKTLPEWAEFDDVRLDGLSGDLHRVFNSFPTSTRPNESQTENDLIWPILERLGWSQSLRNQNLTAHGRDDVPDGLLFPTRRPRRGPIILGRMAALRVWARHCRIKRWARPLDRQSGTRGEETAPSTQMLRYLRRGDDLTNGALRWGILTNGARWRLYYQGARSVSENFFEIDLALVLAVPGHDGGLFAPSDEMPPLAEGLRADVPPRSLQLP